ncbi:MAG: riboflavin synthase [Candidatus Gastranaerophilaceae bacterium]
MKTMFTGIVEEIGLIKSFDGKKLVVECSKVLEGTQIGDSIAIDGCCQTVVSMDSNTFAANVSGETLKITKGFKTGERVNLERALTPATRMGGHIVQGHVDCVGKYLGDMEFEVQDSKYIVYKGSITVNGVSLTVSKLEGNLFGIAVIPHTLENTNLKDLRVGDKINIETDILGRYVEKFLSTQNNVSKINENFLKENGFI